MRGDSPGEQVKQNHLVVMQCRRWGEQEGKQKRVCFSGVILTPRAMKSTAQINSKASSHVDTSNKGVMQILGIPIFKSNHEAYFCWL